MSLLELQCNLSGPVGRTVLADDEFEVKRRLLCQHALNGFAKVRLVIVGNHAHADQGRGHGCFSIHCHLPKPIRPETQVAGATRPHARYRTEATRKPLQPPVCPAPCRLEERAPGLPELLSREAVNRHGENRTGMAPCGGIPGRNIAWPERFHPAEPST